MLRYFTGCLLLYFLLLPFAVVAQPGNIALADERLSEEQTSFQVYLGKATFDSNVIFRLRVFIDRETDSIHKAMLSNHSLPAAEKEKAILSVVSFLKELREKMGQQKFAVFEIPEVLNSFKLILRALIYHQSWSDLLLPLSPRQSRLLASSFWRYEEYSLLNDITVYKQVASAPEYILSFLENNPGFRFADSLILRVAAFDPLKLQAFLLQSKTGLPDKIRTSQNIYLQQIVSLARNRNASELLPFIVPLAEKRITAEEIVQIRTNVTGYFQLLVNTLRNELTRPADSSFIFLEPLRNGIKQKSLAFYVSPINELHSSGDAVRFASVKNLRLEDIYYIITSCEAELYTTSYLGLYQRLIEFFGLQTTDSLFRVVQYDNFRIFMRMSANYNTLTDFLSCMPNEKAGTLLNRFISGIDDDTNTGLERAMDIADSFTGFSTDSVIGEIIQKELESNFHRCSKEPDYYGIRLYSILMELFGLVKQKDSLDKLWVYLGNHDLLKQESLLDDKREMSEVVLFYGDEDGVASFSNFMNLFSDTLKWELSANEFWVTLRSLSDQPMTIYANLPLDTKKGFDVEAQDSLFAFLDRLSCEPTILVHRGHSYHLDKTLNHLHPSVKLAILGSCGGYSRILSVANISPDAQIIVSKKTGSMLINDPLIEVINETLQNKNDLLWTEVWEKLASRFGSQGYTKYLFNEYIPPGKNVSLFVLKLFNYYR